MKTTYKISKSYVGRPSLDRPNYETGLTLDEAIMSLDAIERSWHRNGGTIVNRTELELVVEEEDGSQVIIFEVIYE